MKLNKIFAEIRFEPSFLFEDGRTRNDIVKELKKDFPHFEYREENKMLLFLNPQTASNVQLYQERLVIDLDLPKNVHQIKVLGASIIPFIMRKMDVEKTKRIGVRAHSYFEEIQNNLDASKKLANYFFSQNILDFLGEQAATLDVEPRVSFRYKVNHELTMVVNTGYLHKVKGENLNLTTGDISSLNVESVHPLIDIDISTEFEKKPDQINGVLNGICSNLEEFPNRIWR
ncbi:hypothetical protein MMB75_25630 [Paenibacillus sp. P2(2022)]|uniref:hypothetical protein n=1 Tax=Paenibacillus sp. P2(2022) TaxID=2917813 RepID=UPI0024071983|nr:hypothetical protein [Paenibacillus sp. P2(2022)]MDG0057011.1 hypothetical protein [Paenibacillus sp. P2(2022)]